MKKRSGIYLWAGPGTIRMINLKYPKARINSHSFLDAYSHASLKQLRSIFHLTDAWVTWSWGFSEQTELSDYAFLRNNLHNFQRLGIRTHAYVQGLNLVYDEHSKADYYARNHRGELIPYHRGRKMTCSRNPYTQEYLINKVSQVAKEDVDGVFIDNVIAGQIPLRLKNNRVTFFGCACSYCKQAFFQRTGEYIRASWHMHEPLMHEYIQFRSESITELVQVLSNIVRGNKKTFGTNSLDPKFETTFTYGTKIHELQNIQDYLLFENHDAPSQRDQKKNNLHMHQFTAKGNKPVFVVSYRNGIGAERQYSQHDYNAIYSESTRVGYAPCYKGTEFTTNGVWHCTLPANLTPVSLTHLVKKKPLYVKKKWCRIRFLFPLYNRFYTPFLTALYEQKSVRKAFNWLYYSAIR